jgi:hypothetical protein
MLMARQMVLSSVLLGGTMGMCREVMQFRGTLVVLIV